MTLRRAMRAYMSEAILVVDDDAPIRRMLERTLAAEGYDVARGRRRRRRARGDRAVGPGPGRARRRDARARRARRLPARCARKGLALPILLLTARDAVADRVAGLDAGADDYLVKPFAAEELLARVRALLRRGARAGRAARRSAISSSTCATRVARRGGREIALSAREADLLELLLRNPRQVVTREHALERSGAARSAASSNVVDRYVSYLRRKLGEPPLIQTVRGVGFVLGR